MSGYNPWQWTTTRRYERAVCGYKLVELVAKDTPGVKTDLQAYIDADWQPYGPPVAMGDRLWQPLVRYKQVEEK